MGIDHVNLPNDGSAIYQIDEYCPKGYTTIAASTSLDAINAAWDVIQPRSGGALYLRAGARVIRERLAEK